MAVWEAFFDDVDALVLPPAMTAAFPHCEPGTDLGVDGQPARYPGHGRLLGPATLTGQPALVVPAGRDAAGLPIGVQLIGPRWSEPTLLAIAQELERIGVLPGFQPPPAYR